MINAAEIGVRPEEFWSLTNYELGVQFKGARQRRESLYAFGLWVAWHIAAWTRPQNPESKLPKLETVLENLKNQGKKQDQLSMMYQISSRFGLPLEFRPKKL